MAEKPSTAVDTAAEAVVEQRIMMWRPTAAGNALEQKHQLVQLRFFKGRLLGASDSTLAKKLWDVPATTEAQFKRLLSTDCRITFAALWDSWLVEAFGPRMGITVAVRLQRALLLSLLSA